jgi:hypothetical protein
MRKFTHPLRTFTHLHLSIAHYCAPLRTLRTFCAFAHFRALSRIRALSRTFRAPWMSFDVNKRSNRIIFGGE